MVYRLKPLELGFDFDDRIYELGDRITIRVTLNANGDVDVREARADLVCEEHYSRKESGIVVGAAGVGGIQGGKLTATTDYVAASSWTSKNSESYIHSSVVFLKDTTLNSGGSGTYDAILPIQPVPPTHLDEAHKLQGDASSAWTFKWRLVLSVNVARSLSENKCAKR